MTSLPQFILDALANPVGYRRDFSSFVVGLKEALSAEMDAVFVHDDDMNYNPGQSLTHEFKGLDKAQKRRYAFGLRFYLSAKAPLFAFYCFDNRWGMTDRGDVNHPIAQERLPEAVRTWVDTVKAILVSRGLTEVEHRYFSASAPGCFTQLDGQPASVFESLFAELV